MAILLCARSCCVSASSPYKNKVLKDWFTISFFNKKVLPTCLVPKMRLTLFGISSSISVFSIALLMFISPVFFKVKYFLFIFFQRNEAIDVKFFKKMNKLTFLKNYRQRHNFVELATLSLEGTRSLSHKIIPISYVIVYIFN